MKPINIYIGYEALSKTTCGFTGTKKNNLNKQIQIYNKYILHTYTNICSLYIQTNIHIHTLTTMDMDIVNTDTYIYVYIRV